MSRQRSMAASEHSWNCTCPRHTWQPRLSPPGHIVIIIIIIIISLLSSAPGQTWGRWGLHRSLWTICRSRCCDSWQTCSHTQTQSCAQRSGWSVRGIILTHLSNGCLTILNRMLSCDACLINYQLILWSSGKGKGRGSTQEGHSKVIYRL